MELINWITFFIFLLNLLINALFLFISTPGYTNGFSSLPVYHAPIVLIFLVENLLERINFFSEGWPSDSLWIECSDKKWWQLCLTCVFIALKFLCPWDFYLILLWIFLTDLRFHLKFWNFSQIFVEIFFRFELFLSLFSSFC